MRSEAVPAGYRPCVGVALFNPDGLVLAGERLSGRRKEGPRGGVGPSYAWQMPQGGIDPGESLEAAAARELYEETNVRSVSLLGVSEDWLVYDLPPDGAARMWRGRFRGQAQRWVAFRFVGEDSEIDVRRPGDGRFRPEFVSWRWERLDRMPELIVPFKRPVYEAVVRAFACHAASAPLPS